MRNKLRGELVVCGFNAAAALGKFHPEKIRRLFLREDRLKAFTGLCKKLSAWRRPYKLCADEELERICKSPRHQGVAAIIDEPELAPLSPGDLRRWEEAGAAALVLHSVGNDHNLGAMVRSAAFFGVRRVILSEEDAEARLTTSTYRVAEGGMEQVEFRRVEHTAAFLQSLPPSIITIGTDARSPLQLRDMAAAIGKAGRFSGIALVMGNEETGLPREVKERCSLLVGIPGRGPMESLNVAQAAALFLHELYQSLPLQPR